MAEHAETRRQIPGVPQEATEKNAGAIELSRREPDSYWVSSDGGASTNGRHRS
jgi:hypothetical protein